MRRAIDRFLRRHRVEVQVTAEFDNIETIKQAADEEAGIAILPEPTLRREVRRGTLVRRRLRRCRPASRRRCSRSASDPQGANP